jgi:hypothetical protein
MFDGPLDWAIDYKCCQKYASGAPECYNLKVRGPKYAQFTWVHYDAPEGDRHEDYEADRNWLVAGATFSGAQPDPAATPPLPRGEYRSPSGAPNCQWVYNIIHIKCGPEAPLPYLNSFDGIASNVPESLLSDTAGIIGCPEGGAPTGFCYNVINSGALYEFGTYVSYDDGSGHTGCSWVITDAPSFSGIASGGTDHDDCDWIYQIQWYGGDPPAISGALPGQVGYPVYVKQSNITDCSYTG